MAMSYKGVSQIYTILFLRSAAITIQLFLIIFVNQVLNYQLPWFELSCVLSAELLLTIVSYWFYRKGRIASKAAILGQILADVLFLSLLLYFSGGATNAFVSLLLIPIAIAAVTLTPLMLGVVALSAIASYSWLLWLLPMHVMHGNMEGHFIGMWINFLFSAVVVALVVANMARSIRWREQSIASYREEQLKQEKVISLGVSSAQITHQLATPIATVQLLADELKEDFPDNAVIDDMLRELKRCSNSLNEFRTRVLNIKNDVIGLKKCDELFNAITDNIALSYPEIVINLARESLATLKPAANNKYQTFNVNADSSLLPAVLNLVNNAVRATKDNNSRQIALKCEITDKSWLLSIRDFGQGFDMATLSELGVTPVESKQGLGMAVFLSHASLERLGAKVSLQNHPQGGAEVIVTFPLVKLASSNE